jgi:DNA recombination protein RmuC
MDILIFVLGSGFGGAIAWAICRAGRAADQRQLARLPQLETELGEVRTERLRLVSAQSELHARYEAEKRSWEEKLALVSEAEKKLSDAFRALSGEALRINNEQFLQLAQTALARFQTQAVSDLDSRQKAIGELVSPLRESLTDVNRKLQELEVARTGAYASLGEQVKSLVDTQNLLRSETASLVKALRAPAARGRWGEIQLRRVVEMAGMLEYCDFLEQQNIRTEDGRMRPDLTVRLPNDRRIVVDAKVPLSAYLDAHEAADEATRCARLKDHAAQVRTHVSRLGAKAYWSQLESAPDFVIAFLPGEVFFSAALEADPALLEYGVEQRVLIATPTTLIALLKAVSYGWRQESITRNAQDVSRLGREIYDRLAVLASHFAKVGSCLDRATEAYNQAVGALEGRVLVSARRLKEKGIESTGDIPVLQPVDRHSRQVGARELIEPATATRV